MPSSPLIETVSVLGKKIRTSEPYWEHIVRDKHGELAERLPDALETLRSPDEVYRQGEASDVYLYYRLINRFTLCVVTRHLNGDGFIITAYLTTKKKRKGIQVWFKTTTSNSSSIPTATP